MARNPASTEQPTTEQQAPPGPPLEHPKEGGSYVRDPQTGALSLVEQTKPAAPAEKE